eukprot:1149900-Pelagomonas_calceolata.AAC.8
MNVRGQYTRTCLMMPGPIMTSEGGSLRSSLPPVQRAVDNSAQNTTCKKAGNGQQVRKKACLGECAEPPIAASVSGGDLTSALEFNGQADDAWSRSVAKRLEPWKGAQWAKDTFVPGQGQWTWSSSQGKERNGQKICLCQIKVSGHGARARESSAIVKKVSLCEVKVCDTHTHARTHTHRQGLKPAIGVQPLR